MGTTQGNLRAVIDPAERFIHPSAFEGAAQALSDAFQNDQLVSAEDAYKQLIKCEEAIATALKYLPGAKDSKVILRQAQKVLEELGMNGENTLYGQSICPDEINHEKGDITDLFSNYLGEVFHLGGLAGIPFTGKTGFHAFSHHIPDNGNIFILFAPHIGISDSFQLGKYSRIGQSCDGSACGAAVGALNHCLACKAIPNNESLGANPYDYQMQYLISEVNKRVDSIKEKEDHNERMAELVQQIFDISLQFLENIIDLNVKDVRGNPGCRICLLGGVQINMPKPLPDFFQPLMFEVRAFEQETINLMDRAFPLSASDINILLDKDSFKGKTMTQKASFRFSK